MDRSENSMLTESQREHLRSGVDTDAAARMARKRIRERVYAGLHDFSLILNGLPREDLETVAAEFGPDNLEDYGGQELVTALQSTVAVVYQLARAGGLDAETVIKAGINEGRADRLDVLEERYNQDDVSLTVAQLEELTDAGRIDRDERREWLEKRFNEGGRVGGFVDPDDPLGDLGVDLEDDGDG